MAQATIHDKMKVAHPESSTIGTQHKGATWAKGPDSHGAITVTPFPQGREDVGMKAEEKAEPWLANRSDGKKVQTKNGLP